VARLTTPINQGSETKVQAIIRAIQTGKNHWGNIGAALEHYANTNVEKRKKSVKKDQSGLDQHKSGTERTEPKSSNHRNGC